MTFEDVYKRVNDTEHLCKACGMTSSRKESIKDHILRIHLCKFYTCKFCKKTIKGLRNTRSHIRKTHNDLVYQSELDLIMKWHEENALVLSKPNLPSKFYVDQSDSE